MAAVEEYLAPAKGASALLLGCTHYGLIKDAIAAYLGDETEILSASECAASAMAEYLLSEDLDGGGGESLFYTSGDIKVFDALAGGILNASGCNYKNALRAGI